MQPLYVSRRSHAPAHDLGKSTETAEYSADLPYFFHPRYLCHEYRLYAHLSSGRVAWRDLGLIFTVYAHPLCSPFSYPSVSSGKDSGKNFVLASLSWLGGQLLVGFVASKNIALWAECYDRVGAASLSGAAVLISTSKSMAEIQALLLSNGSTTQEHARGCCFSCYFFSSPKYFLFDCLGVALSSSLSQSSFWRTHIGGNGFTLMARMIEKAKTHW